jgi:hypothetical protein
MPNYANGKIYQIISPNHPVPYIGSTTQPLCKRMVEHRKPSHWPNCSSRILIQAGDAYIELIEEFPCDNKEQLNKREGELIREMECVNHHVAGRTQKEWYEDNKEAVNARHKVYREANKEAINARLRAYRALKKTPVPSVE